MVTTEQVLDALRGVIDPELGLDIVTLGMVYGVDIDATGVVQVNMTLTTQGCPLGPVIQGGAHDAVSALPGVSRTDVRLVWEPAWTPERIDPVARARMMGG